MRWFLAGLACGLILVAATGHADTGYASMYGPGLYGNRMACGGTLTTGTWGVAHRSLPCGSRITVCLRRCATVPVVDRGPWTVRWWAGARPDGGGGAVRRARRGATRPVVALVSRAALEAAE